MTNESDPEIERWRLKRQISEVRIPELEEEIKLLLVPARIRKMTEMPFLEIRGGTGELIETAMLQATCSYATPNTARQKRLETGSIQHQWREQQEVLKEIVRNP